MTSLIIFTLSSIGIFACGMLFQAGRRVPSKPFKPHRPRLLPAPFDNGRPPAIPQEPF